MGIEAYEDDRNHDHDHGHDHGHEHDKCWKVKKERDEYKAFLKDALERLGVAVRKLDHLLDDIVDAGKKIGRDSDRGRD